MSRLDKRADTRRDIEVHFGSDTDTDTMAMLQLLATAHNVHFYTVDTVTLCKSVHSVKLYTVYICTLCTLVHWTLLTVAALQETVYIWWQSCCTNYCTML